MVENSEPEFVQFVRYILGKKKDLITRVVAERYPELISVRCPEMFVQLGVIVFSDPLNAPKNGELISIDNTNAFDEGGFLNIRHDDIV